MSSLKVAVRVRPFNQREIEMGSSSIIHMDGKKTHLRKPKLASIRESKRDNTHDFTFDYSYWSFNSKDSNFATQEQVYIDLGTDVIDCAFQGYNACVFAYGQTGSGKTFTMMGSADNPGLIPRICQELFTRIKVGQVSGTGYKTQASYLEIYNERVKDLLGAQNIGHGLRVREHRYHGPYVENLSQHSVSDFNEIQECINRGNIQRTTASTNMNDTSSRSHAIFTITFVQAGFNNNMPSETVSKIHLVDLAGSERANATGATGQRLKEGAHINKSLVTLGSVISALAEQTNRPDNKRLLYVPYRDSVLTWLLKDSLGGNSKTIMIAAISPADCNYSETLSTLRYANRAKNIINKPTINEDPNVKLIRELRDEINKLKSMLSNEINPVEPSSKMLEDLLQKEAREKVLTKEWTEKWKEAQLILQEQKSLGLRKSGVGVVLDSEMPHLIGIHDDCNTGVTLYSLKEGETLIGSDESNKRQDIVLSGMGIQPEHCSIKICDGNAIIYPRSQAQCWLNAKLIDEPTNISQGDILLLGRTNIFRFNNPAEAAKLRKDPSRSRLDLSRVSLITASRENLCTSYYGEDEMLFSISPIKREKQYYPCAQICKESEIQDENRKILETIENALKQLNIERVQMHDQYKNKVNNLTDELERLEKEHHDILEILNCREQELFAKKDMLLWEKNNERIQIDIVCRQISTLQTQLDSKKRDFFEYIARELQELQDCGKLDELQINITDTTQLSDDILLDASESLDVFASQFIKDTVRRNREEIKKIDHQIVGKEKLLDISTERIAKIDENLLQLNQLIQKNKLSILDHESIQQKKKGMKLNLQQTTDSNDQNGLRKINKIETLETCDTFHTANSDCSIESHSESPPNQILYINSNVHSSNSISSNKLNGGVISSNFMSDSGVCFDTYKHDSSISNDMYTLSQNSFSKNPPISIIEDEDSTSCSSYEQSKDLPPQLVFICKLRNEIAAQKALIMKNLELEVDKAQLDVQISQLQELQRKYYKFEKDMQNNEKYFDYFNDRNEDLTLNSYGDSIIASPVMNISYAQSTRSCPLMNSFQDPEQFLSIPSFVMRGAGKKTHYEYEIRINLPDGKLNLLRRYSRFRELHISMKNCYGAKVSLLSFPRRELFASNSESVAKHRRRLLEIYLRRLFAICSKIPQSPIYEEAPGCGINKITLAKFSNFFQKGLFENGKHGTG